MKTAAYDFILPFFVAADDLRPAMCQIHGDANGFVYATDAHVLIKVPAQDCMLKYEPVDKYPNVEAMFLKYDFSNSATFKTSSAVEILAAYKWMRPLDSDQCTKCEGTGVIECEHCGEEHDCKDCHGKGDITKGIANLSLLSTEDYYQVVKIAGKMFKADFIHILTICAMALNVDKITVLYNENLYDPHIFEVGDARILIMPRTESEDDFIREIKVKQIN